MVLQKTDEALNKSIGRAIAKYRQAAGLTQAQVAELMGISNDAVSRIERGGIMPSVGRLVQLADVFGCVAADLLNDGSNRPQDQARQLERILSGLEEHERATLLQLVEQLVAWKKR